MSCLRNFCQTQGHENTLLCYLLEALLFSLLPLDQNPSGINFNLVLRVVKFVFQHEEIKRHTEGQQRYEKMLNITNY